MNPHLYPCMCASCALPRLTRMAYIARDARGERGGPRTIVLFVWIVCKILRARWLVIGGPQTVVHQLLAFDLHPSNVRFAGKVAFCVADARLSLHFAFRDPRVSRSLTFYRADRDWWHLLWINKILCKFFHRFWKKIITIYLKKKLYLFYYVQKFVINVS